VGLIISRHFSWRSDTAISHSHAKVIDRAVLAAAKNARKIASELVLSVIVA